MAKYTPELGQEFFGNKWNAYECPEFVISMTEYLIKEIERIYWNNNQKRWEDAKNPKLKEIIYRDYYWGENKKEKNKPNFAFAGVKIRWYKHIGRGTTTNKIMTEKKWVAWFNKTLKHIRSQQKRKVW